MLPFRGVQFVDCISKINNIFNILAYFVSWRRKKTLHPYWISDLRHIASNIYLIEVLASPFLSCFLHIPDILFSVLPLNLLVCASSREPRGYCAICGFFARYILTDIFLSVFKITKNFLKINSTIQHPIRFYKAYYIKHFLNVLESRNQTKSIHFQYNDFSTF
jgi:hypothetical protein